MTENNPLNEEQTRVARLGIFQENGDNPYPAAARRDKNLARARAAKPGTRVATAGRLVNKRPMGKICFARLKDFSGHIQAVFSEQELGKENFKFFLKNFDLGDFVEVTGEIFTTHKGEVSILVKKYRILAKALLPLPEKFHGLADVEIRYRKKYLDLLANEEAMAVAVARSRVIRELRDYFNARDFFEVETPILQPLYGGALAEPFITHHNALDIPLYLRVAPELYLKRLIVGGFEKVYEVGRCFRNEGIDHNHNPEFTQIEFYWAYADYTDLMDLVEDLLPHLLKTMDLPLKLKIDGQTVDFTPPYPRVTMRELIKKYAKTDIENYPDQLSMFKRACDLKIDGIDKNTGRGKLIDEIYKAYARPKIINPTFMINHPIELSPLAKTLPDDPRYTERVQLVCVGGNELCNGFSELNDPLEQEKRFQEQERLRRAGDSESMPYDLDFIEALKHGMPPTAGLGMGIDRLLKLFLGADNLKEVILFPTLKPKT